MKKKVLLPALLTSIAIIMLAVNCKPHDDDDDPIVEEKDTLSALDFQINEFIWAGLHSYYLWVDDVPDLAVSKFPTQSSWDDYMNNYSDHEDLFYHLLYKYNEVDKFSWIVDDYVELEQQFQGITKSMGYEFRFGRFSGTQFLFGVVIYVLPGTPASKAGMKRGDLFIKVNGTDITESNYQELMFGSESYTLSFASISGNAIIANGKNSTLTAVEIHENPILFDTVYTISSKKVGYLVYNGFMSDYDVQLNNVFADFKSKNVNELILDLRYNPGGFVSSATYLSSMIYTTDTNKIFITKKYNAGFQEYIDENFGTEFSKVYFAKNIIDMEDSSLTPIVSLGLSRVYILTTYNSASASELVISGLKPYINVITIGDTTYGKYVGSMTIFDYLENGNINPAHKWAMQPIVMKSVNSAGESDYVKGFAPKYYVTEEIATMYAFGNKSEPMLGKAISLISGNMSVTRKAETTLQFVPFGFSKDSRPHSREMIDKNVLIKKSVKQIKTELQKD